MPIVVTVKELKNAAELFKNFDVNKSLNFYGNLVTKYQPVVEKYFNKSSFNNKHPEKGIQPNAMKNFINLIGKTILKDLALNEETDERAISEVIKSVIENNHALKEAVIKIIGIHVGRGVPSDLYSPVAEELISHVGGGNELVKEILTEIGSYFITSEEKQYIELKEKYSIEDFEAHQIKAEVKSADEQTAIIKFYRQNKQEVAPHRHGEIVTVKVGGKQSEFTVMNTDHDEKGHYYECLIKQNPNGIITN